MAFRPEDFRHRPSTATVVFGFVVPALLIIYAISAWTTGRTFWPPPVHLFGVMGGGEGTVTFIQGRDAFRAGVAATGMAVFLHGQFVFAETRLIWRVADVLRLIGLVAFFIGIVPLIGSFWYAFGR